MHFSARRASCARSGATSIPSTALRVRACRNRKPSILWSSSMSRACSASRMAATTSPVVVAATSRQSNRSPSTAASSTARRAGVDSVVSRSATARANDSGTTAGSACCTCHPVPTRASAPAAMSEASSSSIRNGEPPARSPMAVTSSGGGLDMPSAAATAARMPVSSRGPSGTRRAQCREARVRASRSAAGPSPLRAVATIRTGCCATLSARYPSTSRDSGSHHCRSSMTSSAPAPPRPSSSVRAASPTVTTDGDARR